MSFPDDPRIDQAKQLSVREVLERLNVFDLKENRRRDEMFGPCIACGDAGHNPKSGPPDRFNINLVSGAFFCRKCGLVGGDVIHLVQQKEGISFKDALSWLCGEQVDVDPEERQRLRDEAERKARAQAKRQNTYRQRKINAARYIWQDAGSHDRAMVGRYFEARGLPSDVSALPVRFLPDHPYEIWRKEGVKGDQKWVRHVPHSGPCMICPIVDWSTNSVMAVHQTWINPQPPHDKAVIIFEGEQVNSKLVLGSMKGNFIPLITPQGTDTMICAEGVETLLSAWLARPDRYRSAAAWAGVSLGNMAGKMERSSKRGVPSGIPKLDIDEPAWVPPPWVKRLIFVQDGDSDPEATRALLMSGLRRARHVYPKIEISIVSAPPGLDMNDVLRAKKKKNRTNTDD
ncbi:hypothetical protein VWZ88_01220 [Phaeobacter sp. JH20_36]|uniref:DUF7146 domain-containing protein n=1 Tax=unclassified Phaeobacter TaxID=2621772 RepID=UPI003A882977